MFTGIVTERGVVASIEREGQGSRVAFDAPTTSSGLRLGGSVAVNGVCLTAVEVTACGFVVEVVAESLVRSNLGSLETGELVNLERPTPSDGRFDGHIVQGHIDGVGTVVSVVGEGTARRVRVSIPVGLAAYVVEKGSVAVEGVSLTVTAVSPLREEPQWFEVVLIPHTVKATVLGGRGPGDEVNIETDVIAKYVARLLEARR